MMLLSESPTHLLLEATSTPQACQLGEPDYMNHVVDGALSLDDDAVMMPQCHDAISSRRLISW